MLSEIYPLLMGEGRIQRAWKLGSNDFLKLLMTQLRYQNPLSPLRNEEFVARLTQFASLEQLNNLNKAFGLFMLSTNQTKALSLLNTQVSWIDPTTKEFKSGVVNSVIFEDITPKLLIIHQDQSSLIGLEDVISVKL